MAFLIATKLCAACGLAVSLSHASQAVAYFFPDATPGSWRDRIAARATIVVRGGYTALLLCGVPGLASSLLYSASQDEPQGEGGLFIAILLVIALILLAVLALYIVVGLIITYVVPFLPKHIVRPRLWWLRSIGVLIFVLLILPFEIAGLFAQSE